MRRLVPLLLLAGCVALGGLGRPLATARAADFGSNPAEVVGVASTGDRTALPRLGVHWYLTYGWSGSVPAGTQRAVVVRLTPAPDMTSLLAAVKANPGSAWIIGNEPNVPTVSSSDDLTPAQYATQLHDIATAIKQVDRRALIVGPSVLNWGTTCLSGCGPFSTGEAWTQAFYAAYQAQYHTRPSIDVWSIHTYAIDWYHTPMLNTQFLFQQLQQFRKYLLTLPNEALRPIWDTEVGMLWDYPGWQFAASGVLQPMGAYDTAGVNNWLQTLVHWQTHQGLALGVERAFLFAQTPIIIGGSDVAAGLSLFTSGAANATPTPAGQTLAALLRHDADYRPAAVNTTTAAQPADAARASAPATPDPRLRWIVP